MPRQDGREGLVKGAEVTVVFFGRAPAWIRLWSGVVLETEDHPRRKATTALCAGLLRQTPGSLIVTVSVDLGAAHQARHGLAYSVAKAADDRLWSLRWWPSMPSVRAEPRVGPFRRESCLPNAAIAELVE